MLVEATSDKKKKKFEPITITVKVTIEKETELDEFKHLANNHKENKLYVEDNYGDQYEFPVDIIEEIAKQL